MSALPLDARPLDQRAREAWDRDARLREEFVGDFTAYAAYLRAVEAGRIRYLGRQP